MAKPHIVLMWIDTSRYGFKSRMREKSVCERHKIVMPETLYQMG